MTYRLLRYVLVCATGGSLLGLLLGAAMRAVLPAGTVLPFVAFAVVALPSALLWAWLCWWWCMVRP